MKKTIQFSAYQYFLADNFADTQKEWAPYTNNAAIRFLLKYNENLDYLINKMEGFVKNHDHLTLNEINQLKIISNLTTLRELLKFNDNTKSVDIDYLKIDALFLEIKDQEEIEEITRAIDTLRTDNTMDKTNSFAELDDLFDFLISFVKYRDVRRSFYLNFLIQEGINIPQKETKSLFLNRSMI